MAEFGPRGLRLWEATRSARAFNAAELVLLEEVCRMADRLERFDEVLRGDVDTWMRLTHRTRTEDYELVVDAAVAEARQLQATFQAAVKALGLPEGTAEVKDGLDDLAARRSARRA